MNGPQNFDAMYDRVVYVRPINTDELPDHIREQTGGLETVYGVFGSNGEQIALTKDRSMAFHLARDNAFEPLSVH